MTNRGNDNNWLTIRTIGTKSNSFGVGARIKIAVDNTVQIRDVNLIFANKLQFSLPVHFGLGKQNQVDTLTVIWPSGIVDQFTTVELNSVLTIKEGYGDVSIPNSSILFQNYPNPFNLKTTIGYSVAGNPHNSRTVKHVQLTIFNILGQKVKTLVCEPQEANYYLTEWDGTDKLGDFVSSGVYLSQLKIDNQIDTKKLLLLR